MIRDNNLLLQEGGEERGNGRQKGSNSKSKERWRLGSEKIFLYRAKKKEGQGSRGRGSIGEVFAEGGRKNL